MNRVLKSVFRLILIFSISPMLFSCQNSVNSDLTPSELNPSYFDENVQLVLLEPDQISRSSDELKLELQNNTQKDWMVGGDIRLEIKLGSDWYNHETKDNVAWTMEAYELKAGSTFAFTSYLKDYYPDLTKGSYRLVSHLHEPTKQGPFSKAVKFEFMID